MLGRVLRGAYWRRCRVSGTGGSLARGREGAAAAGSLSRPGPWASTAVRSSLGSKSHWARRTCSRVLITSCICSCEIRFLRLARGNASTVGEFRLDDGSILFQAVAVAVIT